MSSVDLRIALRGIPTAVAVAVAHDDTDVPFFGVTIGSFASVSLNPPLVSFNLSKGTTAHGIFEAHHTLSIYHLSTQQEDLSDLFATQHQPIPPNMAEQSLTCLKGFIQMRIDTGDSTLFLVEIVESSTSQNKADKALVYAEQHYTTIL